MRMGAGKYRFIVNRELRACDHWDDIPDVIDELIAFVPEVPPEPHTEAEHDAIDALPAKLQEVMKRCDQRLHSGGRGFGRRVCGRLRKTRQRNTAPRVAMIRVMNGINATNGKRLSGIEHLRQSIRDILTTPIGSRVMRRDYGSRLYQLVDAPMNRATLLDMYAATAEALATWEPRIAVQQVTASEAEPGRVILSLTGEYLPDGEQVTIDGIEVT